MALFAKMNSGFIRSTEPSLKLQEMARRLKDPEYCKRTRLTAHQREVLLQLVDEGERVRSKQITRESVLKQLEMRCGYHGLGATVSEIMLDKEAPL
jgi:hypothetical protein